MSGTRSSLLALLQAMHGDDAERGGQDPAWTAQNSSWLGAPKPKSWEMLALGSQSKVGRKAEPEAVTAHPEPRERLQLGITHPAPPQLLSQLLWDQP